MSDEKKTNGAKPIELAALETLNEPRWAKPLEGYAFEVCLVPGQSPDLTASRALGMQPLLQEQFICERAFIDFRGLVMNGQPVPNSLETRLKLYRGSPTIRAAINNALQVLNQELLLGEPDADGG